MLDHPGLMSKIKVSSENISGRFSSLQTWATDGKNISWVYSCVYTLVHKKTISPRQSWSRWANKKQKRLEWTQNRKENASIDRRRRRKHGFMIIQLLCWINCISQMIWGVKWILVPLSVLHKCRSLINTYTCITDGAFLNRICDLALPLWEPSISSRAQRSSGHSHGWVFFSGHGSNSFVVAAF